MILRRSSSATLLKNLAMGLRASEICSGGSSLPAVRVEVNPTQLNGYGLGLQDVASMLRAQNANSPKGQITDGSTTADVTTNDQLSREIAGDVHFYVKIGN